MYASPVFEPTKYYVHEQNSQRYRWEMSMEMTARLILSKLKDGGCPICVAITRASDFLLTNVDEEDIDRPRAECVEASAKEVALSNSFKVIITFLMRRNNLTTTRSMSHRGLIRRESSLKSTVPDGNSVNNALITAISMNQPSLVDAVSKRGADLGKTILGDPLQVAGRIGSETTVRKILEYLLRREDTEACSKGYQRAAPLLMPLLNAALSAGHENIARIVLLPGYVTLSTGGRATFGPNS